MKPNTSKIQQISQQTKKIINARSPDMKKRTVHSKNGSDGQMKESSSMKKSIQNSNSKQKISRLQTNTNESHNQSTKLSILKSPTNNAISKRFKTENKSIQLSSNSLDKNSSPNKGAKLTKRLKTDLTQRMESPPLVHQRFNNHEQKYNAVSLVELLQFHTGYNQIDQEEFNYRVRKQTEASKMDKNEEQKQQQSSKSASVVNIEMENQKTQEQDEQAQENTSQKQSKQKSDKLERSSHKTKKSNVSKNQKGSQIGNKNQSQSKSRKSERQSVYTLGQQHVPQKEQDKKQKEPNFKKKPKIRSFSLQQKNKLLSQAKYVPQTEQQLRMEARYLKGQVAAINEIRQTEQMIKFLSQYQNSKRLLMQQSSKRHQIKCMMQNAKLFHKTTQNSSLISGIRKSVSLPKIKQVHQFVLPQPQANSFKSVINQQILAEKYAGVEHSLTSSKLHYFLKKQKSLKNIRSNTEATGETENIQQIQQLLRKKGVNFDPNAVRRGLMTLGSMPQAVNNGKIQYPRNLVSNPRYQKYPL